MENKIELLGYYGGNKRHCLSAWQSTTEELGIEMPENIQDRVDVIFEHLAKNKKKSPEELLKFLAVNNHTTPFEKSILDFQITADLASHIHALKHRISSINSESPRYKEFVSDKFYLPEDWKLSEKWYGLLKNHNEKSFELYHAAIRELTCFLGKKRAKETARYFLTYSTQLNFDWQMNFRSFVNIQFLRNDSHAQDEIHAIANKMLYLVQNIKGNPFKYSLKAFNL